MKIDRDLKATEVLMAESAYAIERTTVELLESNRMLRAEVRQINALRDELQRLKELLSNAELSDSRPL